MGHVSIERLIVMEGRTDGQTDAGRQLIPRYDDRMASRGQMFITLPYERTAELSFTDGFISASLSIKRAQALVFRSFRYNPVILDPHFLAPAQEIRTCGGQCYLSLQKSKKHTSKEGKAKSLSSNQGIQGQTENKRTCTSRVNHIQLDQSSLGTLTFAVA